MDSLPTEIQQTIFTFLGNNDLIKSRSVSRKWNTVICDLLQRKKHPVTVLFSHEDHLPAFMKLMERSIQCQDFPFTRFEFRNVVRPADGSELLLGDDGNAVGDQEPYEFSDFRPEDVLRFCEKYRELIKSLIFFKDTKGLQLLVVPNAPMNEEGEQSDKKKEDARIILLNHAPNLQYLSIDEYDKDFVSLTGTFSQLTELRFTPSIPQNLQDFGLKFPVLQTFTTSLRLIERNMKSPSFRHIQNIPNIYIREADLVLFSSDGDDDDDDELLTSLSLIPLKIRGIYLKISLFGQLYDNALNPLMNWISTTSATLQELDMEVLHIRTRRLGDAEHVSARLPKLGELLELSLRLCLGVTFFQIPPEYVPKLQKIHYGMDYPGLCMSWEPYHSVTSVYFKNGGQVSDGLSETFPNLRSLELDSLCRGINFGGIEAVFTRMPNLKHLGLGFVNPGYFSEPWGTYWEYMSGRAARPSKNAYAQLCKDELERRRDHTVPSFRNLKRLTSLKFMNRLHAVEWLKGIAYLSVHGILPRLELLQIPLREYSGKEKKQVDLYLRQLRECHNRVEQIPQLVELYEAE